MRRIKNKLKKQADVQIVKIHGAKVALHFWDNKPFTNNLSGNAGYYLQTCLYDTQGCLHVTVCNFVPGLVPLFKRTGRNTKALFKNPGEMF